MSSTYQLVSFPDSPPGLKGDLGTTPRQLSSVWNYLIVSRMSAKFKISLFFCKWLLLCLPCWQRILLPWTESHSTCNTISWTLSHLQHNTLQHPHAWNVFTVIWSRNHLWRYLVAHKQTDSPVQVLGYLLIYLPWLMQWNNPGETQSFQQPHTLCLTLLLPQVTRSRKLRCNSSLFPGFHPALQYDLWYVKKAEWGPGNRLGF